MAKRLVERLRDGEPIPPAFLTTETQMVPQALLNEAANRIDLLRQVLRTTKNKLRHYREEHGGNYVGGMEYTQLMQMIQDALSD